MTTLLTVQVTDSGGHNEELESRAELYINTLDMDYADLATIQSADSTEWHDIQAKAEDYAFKHWSETVPANFVFRFWERV